MIAAILTLIDFMHVTSNRVKILFYAEIAEIVFDRTVPGSAEALQPFRRDVIMQPGNKSVSRLRCFNRWG